MIGDDFPEVIADARAGDHGAIERIYRDVAPLVIGYLRSNGAREPEDAASDVFVSMLGRLATFTGDERQFRSWLLTITYRRMVDQLRRSGRRPEDPVPVDEMGERAFDLTDGESEAMSRLRVQGLLDAIDGLTDDQRAALMLRVLADLPVRDVADIMGKPESAVKALLRRASATLARRLEGDERHTADDPDGGEGPS